MGVHEIEVRASGGFIPSTDLVVKVGDYLEGRPGLVDPVVAADMEEAVLDVSVEVEAPDRKTAYEMIVSAVGEALVEAGVVDTGSVDTGSRTAVIA